MKWNGGGCGEGEEMKSVPLLFLGDSPELSGGLSRILRDLAMFTSSLPEFRVGVLGRGGRGTRHFPFVNYPFPESGQWGEDYIESIWKDFAGSQRGIIFTIWDSSRLLWFSRPHYLKGGSLKDFLSSGHFQRWGYFPVDSTGPLGIISGISADTIKGYDRILAYGMWGQQQISKATGRADVDWIPHGLDLTIFQPHHKQESRGLRAFQERVHEDDILVGAVMTNQIRKDWGLAFEIFRGLRDHYNEIRFWCHTDVIERYWNLMALANDFGVSADTIITTSFTDQELKHAYSACDVTILPSCEGFGYPLVESMACGTPAIHGTYGGGAELSPKSSWLVEAVAYRVDTPYNAIRPVWNAQDWVGSVIKVIEEHPSVEECRSAVEHLSWPILWESCWKRWFLGGLK